MVKKSLKNKIEEESKINFYGKDMKLSEARTYLKKLKAGEVTIELNEREKMECMSFMDVMKRCDIRDGNKETYFHNYDEKEYLSMWLEFRINLQEKLDKENYCKKNGHIGEKVLGCDSSGQALCYCPNCGDMHDRRMTSQEHREFNELMHTPMTI